MSAVSTDVKSVADQVKERLSGTLAGLIPEEVWNQMIDSGVNQLLEPSVYGSKLRPNDRADDSYSNGRNAVGEKISMLQLMIENELFDIAAKQVQTSLASPEFQEKWNHGFHEPSEGIKKVLVENREAFMEIVIARMFGSVVQSATNEVRNMNLGRL